MCFIGCPSAVKLPSSTLLVPCGAVWWDFILHIPSLFTAACAVSQKKYLLLCSWLQPAHAAAGEEHPMWWSAAGQICPGRANSLRGGERNYRVMSEKRHALNSVGFCLAKEAFCLALLFCTAKLFCKIWYGFLYSYNR